MAFYAVQADTTIADADVVQHTKEYQFSLSRFVGSPSNPGEDDRGDYHPIPAAVLTPDGMLLYLGRIDNLVEDFNVRRQVPTKFDLREALDAVLTGKPVPRARTTAFGRVRDHSGEGRRRESGGKLS